MKQILDWLSGLVGGNRSEMIDLSPTLPTPTPKPTSTPSPTKVQYSPVRAQYNSGLTVAPKNYPAIPYQTDTGRTEYIPQRLAQDMMEVFDPIKQATPSASVLYHPRERTMLPSEEQTYNKGRPYISGGENRGFATGTEVDIPNKDGSIDRGLFRINSNTFQGWLNNPRSRKRLEENGITSYDDMLDPRKNMIFARMLMESTPTANEGDYSWRKWWAAPLEQRHPSLKRKKSS